MQEDEFRDLAAWLQSGRHDWDTPAGAERLRKAAAVGLIDESDVTGPALQTLKRADTELWRAADSNATPQDLARIIRAFSAPLALFAVANCILPRLSVEISLTTARRLLLRAFIEDLDAPTQATRLGFVAALAQQCALNEYCYFQEADEDAWCATLAAKIRATAATGEAVHPYALALLACYVAPLSVCAPEHLLPLSAVAELTDLIERTVVEPLQERELAARMPRLTAIEDATSRTVRAMYEENPYPRWRIGRRAKPVPAIEALWRMFPTMDKTAFGTPPRPHGLLAGCGTGQNVLRFCSLSGGADVTAIDLSLASLSYAKRSTDRLGLAVNYAQADILALGPQVGQFDIIESSGVLHHMADPVAGWRALLSCLRPGGVMRIGLYSAAARVSVRDAWKFANALGVKSDVAGIRRFRREVIKQYWEHKQEPNAPGQSYLAFLKGLDFYSTSMCRDLVFHVQEVQYTIAQVLSIIRDLDLTLLTLYFGNPKDQQTYAERFPEDPHRVSAACLLAFERECPDAFQRMINFGVQKPGAG